MGQAASRDAERPEGIFGSFVSNEAWHCRSWPVVVVPREIVSGPLAYVRVWSLNPKSKIQNPNYLRSFIAACAHLASVCALAQTLLVETETLTAAREAVRVYVQEVSLDTGSPTPMAMQLPGVAAASPLFSAGDDLVVVGTSNSARGKMDTVASVMSAIDVLGNDAWRALALDDAKLAGTVDGNGASGPRAIVVSTLMDGPLRGHGRIDAWPLASKPGSAFTGQPSAWLLPGEPVAAVTNPTTGWVAVLCRTPNGGAVLHVRDAVRGRVIQERAPVARPNDRLAPEALALAGDGSVLFALLNDIDAASESDEGRSRAIAFDARGFAPVGTPLELPGNVDTRDSFASGSNGQCWIATRSPSAGFAFVHLVSREAGQYVASDFRTYTGIARPLVIAADDDRVAMGIEERIEIWGGGPVRGEPLVFRAPIAAMCWRDGALIVGEANRIHRIAPTGEAAWTTSLQTGHVVALHVSNAARDANRFTDTDGDRLADATDPEPDTPSPRLVVPAEVVLREDAAGLEVRAVHIASDHAENSVWRANIDANMAPWLRVFPRQGRSPGWFMVGADPSLLDRGGGADAIIDVSMNGTLAGTAAWGSPRRIAVRVEPRSAASASVLWLLGGSDSGPRNARDSYGLSRLAEALSGPPFFWSHDDAGGRPLESIDDYAAVVLDASAIGAGRASRQSLMDYVSRGGGLLVIARGNEGASRVAQRWLSPLGITFEPWTVSGASMVTEPLPIARHWKQCAIDGGARVQLDAAMTAVASIGDAPCFAVRQFGRGRIAVVASHSPLSSAALSAHANRLFALDLFDWLSRSVIETKDLDADGLPDELEDRNGNGIMDIGETSKLDPDSDGDGVQDGKEDANANGRVDNGETDPLDADTDGDGDWDGADFEPVPAARAREWEMIGGNISDGSSNGDSAAADTGPLAQGASALRLDVTALPDSPYQAAVMLSIVSPKDVSVGRVALRLDTEPPGDLEWFDLRASPGAELAGRRVVQQETKEWGIRIEITGPVRSQDVKALLTVKCRHRFPLSEPRRTTIVTKEVTIRTLDGGELIVDPVRAEIDWGEH